MGNMAKQVKINTLMGKGSDIAGNFSTQGSARIDGKIVGDVTVTDALIVGATGSINGKVSAKSVVVGGVVLGDIIAPEKIELTATAKVLGDISTKVIVIDEKAIFQGSCNMNQSDVDRKARPKISANVARAGRKTAKEALEEALKEVAEEAKREVAEEAKREGAAQAEEVKAEQQTTVNNNTEG